MSPSRASKAGGSFSYYYSIEFRNPETSDSFCQEPGTIRANLLRAKLSRRRVMSLLVREGDPPRFINLTPRVSSGNSVGDDDAGFFPATTEYIVEFVS